MTDDRDDADRVFIRSRWGTNRYVYNPHNPVGRALIVGTSIFAVSAMYLLYHPDLLTDSGKWNDGELRSAVAAASAELSRDAYLGPSSFTPFEDVLRDTIAQHGPGTRDTLSVTRASQRPEPDLLNGGPERADYTVTADGTDTTLCLNVYALKQKMALGYDSIAITTTDGACEP
ncbi:hypothetical protein ACWEQ7_33540 [Streptomyces sp. NPDC004069]